VQRVQRRAVVPGALAPIARGQDWRGKAWHGLARSGKDRPGRDGMVVVIHHGQEISPRDLMDHAMQEDHA
jgi:hypothetical protein